MSERELIDVLCTLIVRVGRLYNTPVYKNTVIEVLDRLSPGLRMLVLHRLVQMRQKGE